MADRAIIKLLETAKDGSGATAAVCLIVNDDIFFGNLGDTECVIGFEADKKMYEFEVLSFMHKVSSPAEQERVKSIGGAIIFGRLFGTLAVARSLGDRHYKVDQPFVSNEAFVKHHELRKKIDRFLILACDGLWDVVSYQVALRPRACRKAVGFSDS